MQGQITLNTVICSFFLGFTLACLLLLIVLTALYMIYERSKRREEGSKITNV